MGKTLRSALKHHAPRLFRISNKKGTWVLDLDQNPFFAFGDPFINDLLVKSPGPADPNGWDFAFFGQLAYRYLVQS